MFRKEDKELFDKKGISTETVGWQIEQFIKGSMPVNLISPATPNRGILVIDNLNQYANNFMDTDAKITKFVPASGAASRMFKALFEFRSQLQENSELDISEYPDIVEFFQKLKKYAFYSDLETILEEHGSLERLLAGKKYLLILDALLNTDGLAYGELPKGLLKFHQYAGRIGRTPFEEHLVEAAKYAAPNQIANLHFTVSPEHLDLFKALKDKVVGKYSDMYSVTYNIEFSIQKSSTDTMAVTTENKPFYTEDNSILFRPGGHGALIENLNDIDSDIIYIKNIDNVIPEKRIESTTKIKKALGGVLLEIQSKVFDLCKKLKEDPSSDVIEESKKLISETFFQSETCISDSDSNNPSAILERLNRPIRVCGMVKNEGEPGGGPFIVSDAYGCESLQIIESSQIDLSNSKQKEIFNASTHFNPVDLVCGVKNFEGQKFDLTKFVDKDTCFISNKSLNGKDLKALELPGLWNGAMAFWNTIFVEVPANTFNPVKTINDLLRDAHQ